MDMKRKEAPDRTMQDMAPSKPQTSEMDLHAEMNVVFEVGSSFFFSIIFSQTWFSDFCVPSRREKTCLVDRLAFDLLFPVLSQLVVWNTSEPMCFSNMMKWRAKCSGQPCSRKGLREPSRVLFPFAFVKVSE